MPTQSEIHQKILALRNRGDLYDLGKEDLESVFRSGLDRFSRILHRLQDRPSVLDVGPGVGLLPALLAEFGHQCQVVDMIDYAEMFPHNYEKRGIKLSHCNIEADPLPFPDNHFDAVTCCQVLEHFTHPHLPAVKEMRRVLKPGGVLELDVPNAVCFRNRWRMIRGKHITWDYKKHYLDVAPISYNNMSFFPFRHNRDFTRQDLLDLFDAAGFHDVEVQFIKSRRYRTGFGMVKNIGSALRDAIPSMRKTLMGFGVK